MEKIIINLAFLVGDEELAADFLDSPILLPHRDIITKAYKESFDMELIDVEYVGEESGRVYTAPYMPTYSIPSITTPIAMPPVAAPAHPTVKHPSEPPTAAQLEFLDSLAESHDVGMSERDAKAWLKDQMARGLLKRGSASDLINKWKALPKRPGKVKSKSPSVPVAEGYYRVTSTHGPRYYRVRKAKTAPFRTYADTLVTDPDGSYRWVYDRGAIGGLAGATPMTYADASLWGTITSHCIVCHAKLTDPDSVARGIGPTCAKNFK